MDKQFDELSKSLAEGVSRREAVRKFGFGLGSVLLAAVGLAAGPAKLTAQTGQCKKDSDCGWPASGYICCNRVKLCMPPSSCRHGGL